MQLKSIWEFSFDLFPKTNINIVQMLNRSFPMELIFAMNLLNTNTWLLVSPIVLIILALLRLVLTIVIECMKPARDSVTIFLISYFISFVPPILSFIVFVLPSRLYLKEFKASLKSVQKTLKNYFNCKNSNWMTLAFSMHT